MITTKKHIAILSLVVCLLASVALAFSFSSVTNANAEGETSYTLTFLGEPTNMIKEGWADGYATIADDVMTLSFTSSASDGYSPVVSLKNGTTYLIKMDIKSNADTATGCWVYADAAWASIFGGATVEGAATIDSSGVITGIDSTWSTVSLWYTPTTDVSRLRFTDWNYKGLQLKNFTITEVVDTKTFTTAGAIGELPTIPEKTGYVGHWEIDGEPITAETNFAATANKTATVVYEKAYTLTYEALPETNMIKEGWDGGATIADDVLTVKITGENHTANVEMLAGVTYIIKFDYQKVAGEKAWATFHLFDGNWAAIQTAIAATDTKKTFEIEYKPTASSNYFILQYASGSDGDDTVMFSNFTVSGYSKKQTLKANEAVGALPEVACGANYRGYWKIGDTELTSETIIDKDTTATPVIEYDGHVFTASEFAFEEAKNSSKEDKATLAIKYDGEETVESWSNKTWETGQFANQAITLNVKKADGTTATVTSSQLQLDSSILWFTFTSKIYGDIVEITIPAGEYKLTDGTGFKLEEITLYQVHYNCWLFTETDYTVEHVAEVEETCEADGCLDYYHCDKCGKYFEDAECTAEIKDIDAWKLDEEGGLLEKTGHEAGSEWKTDDSKHWHECENCGEKMDEAAHSDSDNDKKCDTCGLTIGSEDKTDGKTDGTDTGDKTDDKTDGGEKKTGCGSNASAAAPLMFAMLASLAFVAFTRKSL